MDHAGVTVDMLAPQYLMSSCVLALALLSLCFQCTPVISPVALSTRSVRLGSFSSLFTICKVYNVGAFNHSHPHHGPRHLRRVAGR